MGRNSGHILTPKANDPDDGRRRNEIETNFRPRKTKVMAANPSLKQLQDGDEVMVDNGSGQPTIVRRIGSKLYYVSLIEI